MSEHEIIRLARQAFEGSQAIEQIFKRLPKDTKIKLLLDGRYEAYLAYDGSATVLVVDQAKDADLELKATTEALRRISQNPPSSLGELSKIIAQQGLSQDLRFKLLVPAKRLLDKGYLDSLKSLGPLIQGEAVQGLMMVAGHAVSGFEALKAKLKPKQ